VRSEQPTPPIHEYLVDQAGIVLSELVERLWGDVGWHALERGGVWLDGQRVSDPLQHVAAGAQLQLRIPPTGHYPEVDLEAADLLYEDAWIVVVQKRPGWYVGATPWDRYGNLLVALEHFLTRRDGVVPTLHLAHQLDRDTSGLLLVSKAVAANAPLQAAFATGHVAKRYTCLCAGLPEWEELDLQSGHGRGAGGRWRLYPLEQVGQRLPMGGGRIRRAHTGLKLMIRGPATALVEAFPHTGRTHQIRLHMAAAGHPLVGDSRYGGPACHGGQTLPGHLLHATELQLAHPITGAPLQFHSPLPPHFMALLNVC
jgi:23S rRNA pseudouridine1911/1915/1917 synthase